MAIRFDLLSHSGLNRGAVVQRWLALFRYSPLPQIIIFHYDRYAMQRFSSKVRSAARTVAEHAAVIHEGIFLKDGLTSQNCRVGNERLSQFFFITESPQKSLGPRAPRPHRLMISLFAGTCGRGARVPRLFVLFRVSLATCATPLPLLPSACARESLQSFRSVVLRHERPPLELRGARSWGFR